MYYILINNKKKSLCSPVYGLNRFLNSLDKSSSKTEQYQIRVRIICSPIKSDIYRYIQFTKLHDYNKIILSDEYDLFSVKAIKKLDLKITDQYINFVCILGRTQILDYLKKTGDIMKYDYNAMDKASEYGHINVLEWWVNSGLPLKYTCYAMDNASGKGHINVLEWWVKSKLYLKYSVDSLTYSSMHKNTNMLNWWSNSGLELKYDERVLLYAFGHGSIDVLEWWVNSGLELKHDEYNIISAVKYERIDVLEWAKDLSLISVSFIKDIHIKASESGHINVLEWLFNNRHQLSLDFDFVCDVNNDYVYSILFNSSVNGHVDVLNWWKNKGVKLTAKCFMDSMQFICRYGYVNVLKWWEDNGIISEILSDRFIICRYNLCYIESSFRYASENGHVDVLEWLLNSKLPLEYSTSSLHGAMVYGHVNVLEWWKNSGLELKYSHDSSIIKIALDHGHFHVLDWLKNSCLLSNDDYDMLLKYGNITSGNRMI
jgi:hypothetical protein